MNVHMKKAFTDKVMMGRAHTGDVITTIDAIAAASERFEATATRLQNDKYLSAAGKLQKQAEAARKEFAPEYAKATARVRKSLGHIKAQRGGLKLPEPDKTDLAAALRRQEVRGFLLDIKPTKRAAMARDLVADPMFADAIFEVPAVLSGLDDASLQMPMTNTYQGLKSAALKNLHGDRLRELEAQEEDYRVAEAASFVVRKKLQDALGVPPHEFEKFIRPIEQEADGVEIPEAFDFDAAWDRAWSNVMGAPQPPKLEAAA